MLRARLKHVVGSKERVSLVVGRGGATRAPDPVSLRVLRDGAGFSLLRLDESATTVSHTWHPTLEEAKERASAEYGVADDEWTAEPRE